MAITEYETEIVPVAARRSLWSLMIIWFASPLLISCSLVGGILTLAMGFQRVCIALVVGNLLQLLYCGALGAMGAYSGRNFGLTSQVTFGRKGFQLVTILVATTLLGWLGVEVAIMAMNMHQNFHFSYQLMALFAMILVYAITFFGVRGLHFISVYSAPLYLIFSVYILISILGHQAFLPIWQFVPAHGPSMPLGVGIALVFSAWVDGTTASADYCRWAPTPRVAVLAIFSAFPWANGYSLFVGAVIAAASSHIGGGVFEGHNMFSYLMMRHQPLLTIASVVFLVVNLGSISAHTLYASATEWSNVSRVRFRYTLSLLMLAALAIAMSGIWRHISQWLMLLGIAVPPIGATLIADQLLSGRRLSVEGHCRWTMFIAVALGVALASVIDWLRPSWIAPLWGIALSGVVTLVLNRLQQPRLAKCQGKTG